MDQQDRNELHRRLENWAHVYADRYRKQCAPGFRLYRSPDHYYDGETPRAIDHRDAEKIQIAWLLLEERDRILVGWWHILRPHPVMLLRRVNRIGPTIIRLHSLNHYIRGAEEKLSQHLANCKNQQYDELTI